MRKLIGACVLLAVGVALARVLGGVSPAAVRDEGGGAVPSENGDVNGDGNIDISDGLYLLANLFMGGPAVKPIECPPVPPVGGLPDTGQAKCHRLVEPRGWIEVPCETSCVGQDGSYATGCPSDGRFVDNGDGTVTDNCTGLMWQRETADAEDSDTDWCGALEYCETLDLAGNDDWRLPNVRELQSIVDYGRFGPSRNPIFVHRGTRTSWYWSSTSVALNPQAVWIVDFTQGIVTLFNKQTGLYVRAVRSGAPPGAAVRGPGGAVPSENGDVNGDGKIDISDAVYLFANLFTGGPAVKPIECRPVPPVGGLPDTGQTKCYRLVEPQGWIEVPCETSCVGQDGSYATGCPSDERFVDNGDGTVTDNCTGLMWQRETADAEDSDTDWCGALEYCEILDLAGHDDWRLPNVIELQSIVDYGRFVPSIDPVFGFGVQSSPYWSSTSFPTRPEIAWVVIFINGHVTGGGIASGKGKEDAAYVRAVRTAP